MTVYKSISGGLAEYHIIDRDSYSGKYYISEAAAMRLINKGYRLVTY